MSAAPDTARWAGLEGAAGARVPLLAYALLALLAVALFLPGFTVVPPFDRDEARFAQASYQMLESGNYVDIRFQDEARYKKPIGIYWLQAAATALSGEPGKAIWTYRIPSMLGAVLSVLLTAWIGARLFGPGAGVLGAVMLAGCVVLGVEARMAKTDAVLLATILAAQLALARLYLRRDEPEEGRATAVAFWVAVGISILIKGPLVLLVSGATLAGLALWERRVAWLRKLRPLLGLGIVAALVAPWLIAIAIQSKGAFFAESVGHDMLGKVAGGQEGKGLPPGYYLGTFWITFAPWSFLTLLALPWVWLNRRAPAVRFCVCWIVPTWIVFEAVPTKLLHYTLPAFPAIALLTAQALLDGFARTAEKPRRGLLYAAAALGTATWALLAVAIAVVPWMIDQRIAWAALAMLPPVLALYVWGVRLVVRGEGWRGAAAALGAAAVLYAATYALVLPGIDGLWISRSAAQVVSAVRPCPGTTVASAGYSEPSLVFLVGTRTKLVNGEGAAKHLLSDRACALALVDVREQAAFRAALDGVEPKPLGEVHGLNYNNGRRISLTLYAAPP
ncbi:glycosyltransferase family 39 protein [Azospirillum sp. TSO22-1]|uniref:ArnT family glycosyltransferase n=1 Tax=Azospirillum sp. TSO22-1 TaxID=716789 RepID=UPI000D613725|nr:glycosyltransferase family 39 protein [Azospirillum sp. TSO22-1]PWC42361.1 glycosyl transferase [Azospirillum sp. TSO22-1]